MRFLHQAVRSARALGLLVLACAGLAVSSCAKDDSAPTAPPITTYDFSLVDLNPTSATNGQLLSPAQHLGKPVVLFIASPT